ncbi:MAG: amino acid ABC transporter substrate-binding protein [Ruminococcus sp.]|nr:amino acid ABC transporter substrate-binding protein [Ruminococcus sp.]
MKYVNLKRMLAVLAAAAMAVSFIACGGNETAQGDTEKFVVGFDAEFPPYGYQDENGEYVGFDLDLAAEVCERNNWELVKQPIDWNAKDMELNSGTISCIWNGFTMNGREDEYAWTDPYIDNSQVFVVKADSGITDFAGLADKGVAVQTDSSAEDALEENTELTDSFKELVVVSDYNTAFMNLDSGAVDAIAMDIGVAKYQIESREGEYVMLEEILSAEQYAVGFALDNTELRDKVQATLNEMKEDGTFEKIAEEWELSDSIIQ